MQIPLFPVFALALFGAGCSDKDTMVETDGGGDANPAIVLLPEKFTTEGEFLGNADLSGLATLNGKEGIIVNDETRSAQAITIDLKARTIKAGAEITLLTTKGKTETDLEGAASNPDANCYYVTGSHGVSKKKGEFQQERCHVFRIKADPVTGAPMESGVQIASLWPWLAKSELFSPSLRQPLQQKGFNIEGLAFRDGNLYFGVRGPNIDGQTFVIETNAEGLFSGKEPEAKVHKLTVGAGQGIRELATLKNGFLVMTGNAGSEPPKQQPTAVDYSDKGGYTLFHWMPEGEGTVKKLGSLPKTKDKGEGLLILEETETSVTVMVVFDGASDGGMKIYKVAL